MGNVAEAPASADSKVCSCYGREEKSATVGTMKMHIWQHANMGRCAQPVDGGGLGGGLRVCGVGCSSYLGIVRHVEREIERERCVRMRDERCESASGRRKTRRGKWRGGKSGCLRESKNN
jgi:hypothetical protein